MRILTAIKPEANALCEHRAPFSTGGWVVCRARAALLVHVDGQDLAVCPECFVELYNLGLDRVAGLSWIDATVAGKHDPNGQFDDPT